LTLNDANTARWLYYKAETKKIAPPQTLFPGSQDGQNLISWRRSLPSPTDPVWWRSTHAISSYRGNRPTNKPTNKHTHTHKQTGPITIHCAA